MYQLGKKIGNLTLKNNVLIQLPVNVSFCDVGFLQNVFNRFSTIYNIHVDNYYFRSVLTFIGDLQIFNDLFEFISLCFSKYKVDNFQGQHPTLGVVDVVPFVPLKGISTQDLVLIVYDFANVIFEKFNLDVYFYGYLAYDASRFRPKFIRKSRKSYSRISELREKIKPDLKASRVNTSLGAMLIGVRDVMVAFNVALKTNEVAYAKEIASIIRESGDGFNKGLFEGLEAIGVEYNKDVVHVSMNVLNPYSLDFNKIFKTISYLSYIKFNVDVAYSEIIGVLPESIYNKINTHFIKLSNFKKDWQVIYGL